MKKSALITVFAFFASLVSVSSFALELPKTDALKDAAVEMLGGKDIADKATEAVEEATAATENADVATDAVAATDEVKASDDFAAIDSNADGMISMDEATVAEHTDLVNGWSTVDANADGQLDAAEFSAFEMTEIPAAVETPAIEAPAVTH
ncbi:MAG: hypothetical protein V3V12_00730 [Gammaproteobacteria bacterium]